MQEEATVTNSEGLEQEQEKMLVKTGLLIVSNPKHVGKILPFLRKRINNTLYVQMVSALTDPFGSFYPRIFDSWPKYTQIIKGIYTQATNQCADLDVRVLLSGLKHKNLECIQTSRPIDLIIFDKQHSKDDIDNFIRHRIKTIAEGYKVITTDTSPIEEPISGSSGDGSVYKHSVLGGTFDRLHVAHKLLLTEAVLRASDKITVGITDENMLETKTLWELVEPINKRICAVVDFLNDVDSELERDVLAIRDMYGPTKDDPTMDVIVVSAETARGAEKINEMRQKKDLKLLEVVVIDLLGESNPLPHEETKVSSSTARIRCLGTLLRSVVKNPNIPDKPYIIGLTGGICTGKSSVAERLSELGAYNINCDKLAHNLYEPGKPAYKSVIDTFGESILLETGEINRRVLGNIVFRDPKQLQKLNALLWPAIFDEVREEIGKTTAKVIVIEAAILLGAGWDKFCHEVWVTVVPLNIAIKRLQKRNNLTEDEARARLSSQMSNKKYVDAANVVISSAWDLATSRKQVDKAWGLLQGRISC